LVFLGCFAGIAGKFVLETGHGASYLATDIYWKAVEKLLTLI